jgi:hypothetical protein
MVVNAYLLPETFDNKPVVKKVYSPKRLVFGIETDLTGNLFTTPSAYNEYQTIIDFIAIRGSQMAEIINSTTIKLTNVSLPLLPTELYGTFDINNWFRVYINGEYYASSYYTFAFSSALNEITFTFINPCDWTNDCSGFDVNDEIAITGKFQEL